MPPSGHHRQRFTHNPLHRPVRLQDAIQASSTSHVSQQAQIFPSNADVESQGSRNTAAAGATVAIVVVVTILVCSAVFFLVRYRRKHRKVILQPLQDNWSWIDVGAHPPREDCKPEEQAEVKPQSLSRSGEEPVTILSNVKAQAHSPEILPRSPAIDENCTSPPGSPSKFHLPSFTFTLPSPVTPAPTRDSAASSVLDSRRESLLDECMNAMMGEGSMDAAISRPDRGRVRRESGDSAVLNEQSWWSNDSGQSSSGPSTPSEKSPVRNPDSSGHSRADPDESDKPGWELLTKMRKFLPSTPPSLKSSVTFEPDSSSVAVRRSFTSPAFFTMVTPPNNSATCLKSVPDKRESVTSNYILAYLDGQGKLGLDLMDEALPPPAIMVSPPTVSTLDLCRQSMISLDQFADAVDPWSIGYGVPPSKLNVSSTPAAFNMELSRRKGDVSVMRPSRPPKSRRRTYVQQQVEAY